MLQKRLLLAILETGSLKKCPRTGNFQRSFKIENFQLAGNLNPEKEIYASPQKNLPGAKN